MMVLRQENGLRGYGTGHNGRDTQWRVALSHVAW